MFYRPPSSGSASLNVLYHSLSEISNSRSVTLGGDFNLRSREVELLSDLILTRSLNQLVQQPTRGENILDLLLTNSPGMVSQGDVFDGLPGNDHEAVQLSIKSTKPPLIRHNLRAYNFIKADFNQSIADTGSIYVTACHCVIISALAPGVF